MTCCPPTNAHVRASVRQLCNERIDPYVADWFERGQIDDLRHLAKELGALGLLGMHLEGYGCAGHDRDRVRPGMPRARGDRLRDPLDGVGAGLAGDVRDLALGLRGAEAASGCQRMAPGEAIGCFGLTEPDHGSDPASMRTRARRDGSDWVLDGRKMWITNGSVADVAVVWAQTEEGIRGFVVPTDTPGFSAPEIKHKLSLRASVTSELVLDGVRLPGVCRSSRGAWAQAVRCRA